jgi:hypothetical protein
MTCAKPLRENAPFCPRCGRRISDHSANPARDLSGWTEEQNRRGAQITAILALLLCAVGVVIGLLTRELFFGGIIAGLAIIPGALALQCQACAAALRRKQSRNPGSS